MREEIKGGEIGNARRPQEKEEEEGTYSKEPDPNPITCEFTNINPTTGICESNTIRYVRS